MMLHELTHQAIRPGVWFLSPGLGRLEASAEHLVIYALWGALNTYFNMGLSYGVIDRGVQGFPDLPGAASTRCELWGRPSP